MDNQYLHFVKGKFVFNLLPGIIVFLFFAGAAQAQNLTWAKQAGSTSFDIGAGIAVDAFGNSYITGSFQGSAIFGEGETNETILNSSDFLDIFIAKYSTNGSLLWAKQAGGSEEDAGNSIAVDALGNIYITGLFEEVAIFGSGGINQTTLLSVGSRDIFIAKYDAAGLLLWAKQAGGIISNDHAEHIVADASGNSYVTGFFNDLATFGAGEVNETTLSSAGSFDIYIAKYNADGLLLWAKQAGSSSFDIGAGIAVNVSNNIFVTGFFEGSAIFGAGEVNETTLVTADMHDIFVAKYSADGLLLWAKQAGNLGNDEGYSIVVDNSDNCYLTGHFEEAATFGAGEINEATLTSEGDSDIFVAKYDPGGLLLWTKQAGGVNDERGYGIVIDAFGNSYITGQFQAATTFGKNETNEVTLTSLGLNDIFLARYDDSGLLQWARQAGGYFSGGGFDDTGAGVGIDAFDNIYITGQFQAAAIFGAGEGNETTLTSKGGSDIFIAKYEAILPMYVEGTSTPSNDFRLAQNYPNPFNPSTTISYTLSKTEMVVLSIYDIMGRKIKILVNEIQYPGTHRVNFNARTLSSGIYFYKFQAGNFTETRKMLLSR